MSRDFFVFEAIWSDPRLRYLPVMITQLMLSLKKAATSQEHGWSLGEPSVHMTMRFARRRGGVSTRDDIRLESFTSTHEETQGQE